MKLYYFAFSTQGTKSEDNEDFYTLPTGGEDSPSTTSISQKGALFVVCDGMGGHNAGEVASQLTATWLQRDFYTNYSQFVSLISCIHDINAKVYQLAKDHSQYSGMGTTLVSLLLKGNQAIIHNVGDSRCYIYARDELKQITEDHSEVWEFYRQGLIEKDDIIHHQRKNIITQAMGLGSEITVNEYIQILPQNFCYILCTDGITDVLTDDQMEAIIQEAPSMQTCCQQLSQAARQSGAKDDITIVMVSNWMVEET